jgi:4-hydroxythreonine-4-phosphate dehydrogenase
VHLYSGNRALAAEAVLLNACPRRILIFADDLSGAADCAAAFARARQRVVVQLDWRRRAVRADVLAIDLDTRRRGEVAAARLVREALRRHVMPDDLVYKKIDSTLRGHVAAEFSAARAALPGRGVLLAPAFPAQGRVVRKGRVLVHGRALATRIAGLRDAANDADLARLARQALAERPLPLFVGSAGLAHALARLLGARPARYPPRLASAGASVLAVVGSRNALALEQARRLASRRGVAAFEIPARLLAENPRSAVLREAGTKLSAALGSGRDAVVSLESGDAGVPGERLAAALGRFVARHGRSARVWLLTGGDTARGVLEALRVSALQIVDELERGVPVSVAARRGRPSLVVCTKAGGFGSPDTLVRSRAALRRKP